MVLALGLAIPASSYSLRPHLPSRSIRIHNAGGLCAHGLISSTSVCFENETFKSSYSVHSKFMIHTIISMNKT